MLDLLDICARMFDGPMMTEKTFDNKVFYPSLKSICAKYDIHFLPNTPVNYDDSLVDRTFEAALELLEEVGLFSQDTERQLRFSKDEILSAISSAPGSCIFGEGRDARLFSVRTPEDFRTKPWCHIGGGMHCSSDEIASRVVEKYSKILEADSISMPAVLQLRNIPVHSNSPIGIMSAIHSSKITRRALSMSGRPFMPILNLHPSAASAIETIAASLPAYGLRPSDGWLVGFPAEFKIDYGAMNKVAFLSQIGGRIGSQSAPLLGGYCGGPEGVAVTATAYCLAGILAMKAAYHLSYPIDINLRCSTTREILWAVSLSCQAITRFLSIPLLSLAHTAAGPFTEMYFYEATAHMLCSIVSGASVQSPMAGTGKGKKMDFQTPIEGVYCARFIPVAQKISRREASDLVNILLDKYERNLKNAPQGYPYQKYYTLQTGHLKHEYREFYKSRLSELKNMGFDIAV